MGGPREVGGKWGCPRRRREAGEGRKRWAAGLGSFRVSEVSLQLPLPSLAPPHLCPSDVDVPGGRSGRLGNLSVLSEMSAEINLANPPRWPVTLISLKFQAD